MGAEAQEVAAVGLLVLAAVGDDTDTAHGQHGLQGHNGPGLRSATPAASIPTPQYTQHSCRAPSSQGVPGVLAPGCLPHSPTLACSAGLAPPSFSSCLAVCLFPHPQSFLRD